MQTQRVCFVALCVCLAINYCDCTKHNNSKARSKHTTQTADDEPEGKIFGWKRQPQNNFIFLNRPTAIATTPIVTATTAINTPTAAAALTTTGRRTNYAGRPIIRRYGGVNGYRRVVPRAQPYRYRQQPWKRRRVWPYGREEEKESDMIPSKINQFDNVETEDVGGAEGGVKVSSKLDVEQLGKSVGKQGVRNYKNAGQIVVNADDRIKPYKTHKVERLKLKSEEPQTAAILAPTMPTTVTAITTTGTANNANKSPTYAEVVVDSNDNINKRIKNNDINKANGSSANKRQSLWQGITERWRERRKRRKIAAQQNAMQQSAVHDDEEEEQEQEEEDEEDEYDNMVGEIFIDENGKIHIKKQRKNNYNNNRQQMKRQEQQEQQQQHNDNDKQNNKKRKQQAVSNKKKKKEISVISANNTNSRLQNIMNAFRRTPIVYKQGSR